LANVETDYLERIFKKFSQWAL